MSLVSPEIQNFYENYCLFFEENTLYHAPRVSMEDFAGAVYELEEFTEFDSEARVSIANYLLETYPDADWY